MVFVQIVNAKKGTRNSSPFLFPLISLIIKSLITYNLSRGDYMFKKLTIKRKAIVIIIFLLLITSCYKLFLSTPTLSSVFNFDQKDNIWEEDLNGDKKKDTIFIKYTSQGFIAQVNLNKNKTFSLDYTKDLPTLGEYCDYWPLRISTLDISRDNSKEIFLQSSFHNKPIQHIFTWDGYKYVNILSSTDNILGFLDSSNTRTPKVFLGNFENGDMKLKNYIYSKDRLEEITAINPLPFPGEDTISSLISLIETLPNQYITVPDYFYSQISGADLESLFRLANGSNSFVFQDGYFIDLAWQENGTATCFNWILNFRAINTTDSSMVKNVTINLMLNKYRDENFPYKITSFNVY